jgi:hypothetical protein
MLNVIEWLLDPGELLVTIVLAPVLAAVIFWIWQIYHWLLYGEWYLPSLWELLAYLGFSSYPSVSWLGIQKIIDYLMNESIGWYAIFLPAGWWVLWLWILIGLSQRQDELRGSRLRQ